MLRVPVHKIQPGMVLARPVALPSRPEQCLLERDREIPLDAIPGLLKLGVLEVWVRHPALEFLEDVIDEELGECQRDVYTAVRRNFESVKDGAATELDLNLFTRSISELFEFLQGNSTGNILLQKLDAFDNYLMSHSANVCYLALLVGMKLDWYLAEQRPHQHPREAKDLQELGLGCLLHDVGKMRIPPEILNKPGKLTKEEMDEMMRHPVYGYAMVRGRVSNSAAQIVLNHHQRWAGGGYPKRIDLATGEPLPTMYGRQIPVFARIATVVDVYDAATAKRCYSDAKPPVQALHEMRTWCRGFFDPVIERAFYQIIPPFPIGQVVDLSNGLRAAVVDFNPRHPVEPKVRILGASDGQTLDASSLEEIELANCPELSIVAVDGVDVRPFLDSQRGPIETPRPSLV